MSLRSAPDRFILQTLYDHHQWMRTAFPKSSGQQICACADTSFEIPPDAGPRNSLFVVGHVEDGGRRLVEQELDDVLVSEARGEVQTRVALLVGRHQIRTALSQLHHLKSKRATC